MVQADSDSERTVDAPFEVSNTRLGDGSALQARMDQDGYLFFRGLSSTEAIREARREVLGRCAEAGWLKPGEPIDCAWRRPASPGQSLSRSSWPSITTSRKAKRSTRWHT